MAEENKEIVIVDNKTIQEKIYLIRGQKVMLLDSKSDHCQK